MEKLDRTHDGATQREGLHAKRILNEAELVSIREHAFRSIILRKLIERFEDNLSEVGFSDDDIKTVLDALTQLNQQDALTALAIPPSIIQRRLSRLREEMEKGEVRNEQVPSILLNDARVHGYEIGFHSSPFPIVPNPKTKDWYVRGTEPDHRDGDLPRAYFAKTYGTIYRSKKNKAAQQYLYIVRADRETTKTDGNWSRANALAIVDEVSLADVDAWVESNVRAAQQVDA